MAPCNLLIEKNCKTPITHDILDDSSSESDVITKDTTSTARVASTNLLRRSKYETSMRKKRNPNKNGEELVKRKEIIKSLGMEVSQSHHKVRTSSMNLRGGDSIPSSLHSIENRGGDSIPSSLHSIENHDLGDETISNDSASSSEKLSEHKTGWTCSTCTETESQQRDPSPSERPAKKSCGAHASSEQYFQKVPRVWNSIERITSKRVYHSNGRIGETNERMNVYDGGSQIQTIDKDLEDSHHCMSQRQTYLQDKHKLEKQIPYADKSQTQEPRRHTHAQSVLEISTKIIGAEQFHAEIAWLASSGSTQCSQQLLDHNDKIDECVNLKIETVHEEESHSSNGLECKEHTSHNKLRQAVEAVWKTSLGTKTTIENIIETEELEKDLKDNHSCCLHNEVNANLSLSKEEHHSEEMQKKDLAPEDIDEKVSAYKKAWKAIGTNNNEEDKYLDKELSDPVFWCIQRDHENLEALVAKEEDLQRDQNDPTKEAKEAENNVVLREGFIEAGEGTDALLNERAAFHSKFKEELEQGVSDDFKPEDSLSFHTPRPESKEARVSEFKRRLQESSTMGKWTSPPPDLKPYSNLTHANLKSNKTHSKLMAESESRIVAEARASYFKACTEVAEERLHSLMGERNWYYNKFLEEVEYKHDMKRLQHLLELEKANQTQGQPQKKKLDVRSLVASSVANDPLDEDDEDDQGEVHKDLTRDGVSCPSHHEELVECNEDGKDDIKSVFVKWEQELGKSMNRKNGSAHDVKDESEKQSHHVYEDEKKLEESSSTTSSSSQLGDRDTRHEFNSHYKIYPKNERKRPFSPLSSSNKQDEKPIQNLQISHTIENNGVRRQSPYDFKKSPRSSQMHKSTCDTLMKNEESDLALRSISNSHPNNCVKLIEVDNMPLALSSNWKTETKEELRRIIQEHELTWKIAENAVEDLDRRLELLESFKTNLQETLKRRKALSNTNCLLSRLGKNLEDFPIGFNLLYSCPIFEEQDVEPDISKETINSCLSPKVSQISKDYEIQILKAEIAYLKEEISGKEKEQRSQNKAYMTDIDASCSNDVFEEHHSAPLKIATETKLYPPDQPFQEEKSSAQPQPSSQINSTEYVDQHVHYEDSTPIDEVYDLNESWPHTPNGQIGGNNSPCVVKEDSHTKVGISKADEGHFQAAMNVVKRMSDMFLEQEANLKNLSAENEAHRHSSDSRAFYSELLKTLSLQLAKLCHDLNANIPPHEELHETLYIDKKKTPTIEADDFTPHTKAQKERTKERESNEMLTNHIPFRVEQPCTIVQPSSPSLPDLIAALDVAERRIEETAKNKLFISEKLESQAKHISEITTEHADQLVKKDQRINSEQQLYMQLSSEMVQAETNLVDCRSHSKGLVLELDGRLQSARSELPIQQVTSLRNTIHALKSDLQQKENLALSLKEERNRSEVQIQDLKNQIQMFQSKSEVIVVEKLKLARSIDKANTEADEQNHCIKEFIAVNENLISMAQSTEKKILTLTKMATTLQQSIDARFHEAKKLHGENSRFSENLSKAKHAEQYYEHHSKFLQSKLEETEKEVKLCEEAMDRLTEHLGKTIEGHHFILEEKDKLFLSLNNAQLKEQNLDEEVKCLKATIRDLEDKLNSGDVEINRIRVEMDDIMTRKMNAFGVERQTKELRNRVNQLEDDVMEKEGQITILTTAFP